MEQKEPKVRTVIDCISCKKWLAVNPQDEDGTKFIYCKCGFVNCNQMSRMKILELEGVNNDVTYLLKNRR